MSPQTQRMLAAMARRVAFAGLMLLAIWGLFLFMRQIVPQNLLDSIREQRSGQNADFNDWSRSWVTSKPVGEMIGERMPGTLQVVSLGALFALGIAGGLLGLGLLISNFTERPGWLSAKRRILRQVLAAAFTSSPVLLGIVPLMIFLHVTGLQDMGTSRLPANTPFNAFLVSLVPAWLLVQGGIAAWRDYAGPVGMRVGRLALASVARVLKLSGAVFSISILLELAAATPGLGRLLLQSVFGRDMPLAFGVAWQLTIIVVVAKLAGDLLEIIADHLLRPTETPLAQPAKPVRRTVPTAWMIVCLALVFVTVVAATIGPTLAPYDYNQISFTDRLMPPSSEHVMGTDNIGRDVFTRLLFAVRLDTLVSMGAVAVIILIAAAWALLAAYLKKRGTMTGDVLHDVVMLPRDILCAVPWLVLLLLLMVLWGPSVFHIAVVIGIVLLPRLVGMIHEGALSAPEGNGWLAGLAKSLPATALLTVAGGVVAISAAGYVGLGVPPPVPELGTFLSGEGMSYLTAAPWVALWPMWTLTGLLFIWVLAGTALWEWLGFRSGAAWGKALE